MKKSLSILLSIAMAFSIFASVAMGAEANLSVEAKYQALVEAGIFTGDGADQAANLDHNMTRAQFAAVLVRTFELSEDAATSNVYVDLDGAGWAAGYIGAVTKAGLMNGRSANEFAPSANVKIEELATVLVRAFDLQQSTSGVTGTVDEWARGYVGAALQAGLISAKADYTVDALRADLVESAYVVYQIIVELTQPEVAFKATSAKTIEVTFSKGVDKDKVTFEVKNSVGTTVSATAKDWNATNTTVTLETAINLLAGEYTITVTGAAANALTGKITIQDEKVAAIQILSDTAPAVMDSENPGRIDHVNVHYKVVNQYGQDVTRAQAVNWQSSLGTVNPGGVGVLEIKLPDPNYVYRIGSEFTLNGYIIGPSNTTVNATLKIGEEAKANTIEVEGLYHGSDKTLSVDMDSYDDFVLLLNVKDQYGNPVKASKLNSQLNVFSSNPYLVDVRSTEKPNPEFIDNAGANANQLGLKLVKAFTNENMNMGGVATITISPVFFANRAVSFDLNVEKAAEVASFTMSQPTGVVATGDVDVMIPVTALDQNGKEVTKKAVVDSNKGVNIQPTIGSAEFAEKDGKLFIKYNPVANYVGPAMITAIVRSNGQMSQLQLNVRDEKVPAAVSAMTTIDTTLKGVANEIKGNSFTVLDQYGTAMAMDTGTGKFYDKYNLKVVVSAPSVADVTYTFTTKADPQKITLNTKGSVTLKVSAVNKDGSDIHPQNKPNYTKASEKDFTLRFVDWADITSFEVADIAKLFDNSGQTDYSVNAPAVTVTGKTSGGAKVNIGKVADGNFSAVTTTKGIAIVGDTVKADGTGAFYAGSDIETKGLVLVTVLKPNATQNIQKDVVISKATPVVSKVELANVEITAAALNQALFTKADADNGVAAGLLAGLKATDQYGIEQLQFKKDAIVIISDVTKVEGSTLKAGDRYKGTESIAGAKNGDKFSITVVAGGHVVVAKVTVK